jgi:hypothetical protein
MSEELVRRLRSDDPWCQPKCNDAADPIEALEAENARMRAALEHIECIGLFDAPPSRDAIEARKFARYGLGRPQ